MRPYIDFHGQRLNLPQQVDPYKFEVCSRNNGEQAFFLLCRKVSQRYSQITGVVMERKENELDFHLSKNKYAQGTFTLSGTEIIKINIDWNASTGSITIKHEEGD